MIEEWRAIPGYEDRYIVSSLGRVASLRKQRGVARPSPLVLKQRLDKDGYFRVGLHDGGRQRLRPVHHLVCEAFCGPRPSPNHLAAHADGSRTFNRPNNLRWATARENSADRDRHGRTTHGSAVHTAKLTSCAVRDIRASSESCAALAAIYGVSDVAISYARAGKTWRRV